EAAFVSGTQHRFFRGYGVVLAGVPAFNDHPSPLVHHHLARHLRFHELSVCTRVDRHDLSYLCGIRQRFLPGESPARFLRVSCRYQLPGLRNFMGTSRKSLLIIFYRNPRLGTVKTRLAATLGKEKALAIFQKLTLHTKDITRGLAMDKAVFYSEVVEQ